MQVQYKLLLKCRQTDPKTKGDIKVKIGMGQVMHKQNNLGKTNRRNKKWARSKKKKKWNERQ